MRNVPMLVTDWWMDNVVMWPFHVSPGKPVFVRILLMAIYLVQGMPLMLLIMPLVLIALIIEVVQESNTEI